MMAEKSSETLQGDAFRPRNDNARMHGPGNAEMEAERNDSAERHRARHSVLVERLRNPSAVPRADLDEPLGPRARYYRE